MRACGNYSCHGCSNGGCECRECTRYDSELPARIIKGGMSPKSPNYRCLFDLYIDCKYIMLTTKFLDAKFEVLGSPFSLLSVSLSPSQNLYTRRGSLVAVSGKTENVIKALNNKNDGY